MNLFAEAILVLTLVSLAESGYKVGVGRADITGPAAEVGMMGYAKQGQTTKGIHMRLYARAFIIEDADSGTRIVFVSTDEAMMGQLVKLGVIKELEKMFPGVYNETNVVLSATHTHSGPAGFMQYLLFNIPNLGFIQQTLDAMVEGTVESIRRAHMSMIRGKVFYSAGFVEEEANINRSPTSYDANPKEERDRYKFNTDRDMVQLNFFDSKGTALGVFNWYAVHGTSMNNTNHLISGDNKGAASLMFEKKMNPNVLAGKTPFVAAFASTNLGDVSPNIRGPKCLDTGLPCDAKHSTCHGKNELCVASGPGKNMFESTKIIAERQFKKSYELFSNVSNFKELIGPVGFIHQWIDMSSYKVKLSNGTEVSTCKPSLGYSFAAGTTDGPGDFNFIQGETTGNPFWNFVSDLLEKPSAEQVTCHAPKPILLDTGEYTFPFPWHPTHVDTQILRIGSFMILAVPGEFTTMSGRRLRESVSKVVRDAGLEMDVVIAGLSNSYTHYIATFEEYQKQRYEAASTIYGPHTLNAYVQQFGKLTEAMLKGTEVKQGTPPPDLSDEEISFVHGVIYDGHPWGLKFGDCVQQPVDSARGSTVSAKFVSGHLRNNLMLESSFMTVEMLQNGTWNVIATDTDWETKIEWKRTNELLGRSTVTVSWEIPKDAAFGTYRLGHMGYYKQLFFGTFPYKGWSEPFKVSGNKKKPKAERRKGWWSS